MLRLVQDALIESDGRLYWEGALYTGVVVRLRAGRLLEVSTCEAGEVVGAFQEPWLPPFAEEVALDEEHPAFEHHVEGGKRFYRGVHFSGRILGFDGPYWTLHQVVREGEVSRELEVDQAGRPLSYYQCKARGVAGVRLRWWDGSTKKAVTIVDQTDQGHTKRLALAFDERERLRRVSGEGGFLSEALSLLQQLPFDFPIQLDDLTAMGAAPTVELGVGSGGVVLEVLTRAGVLGKAREIVLLGPTHSAADVHRVAGLPSVRRIEVSQDAGKLGGAVEFVRRQKPHIEIVHRPEG